MSYRNAAARLGIGTNNQAEQSEYPLVRWSNDYMLLLSLYRSSWIIRKVVDVPAEDMLKEWPRITSEITPKAMKEFEQVIIETGTHEKTLEALKWGRLFGGAIGVICLDGVATEELAQPLKLEDVEVGSYRGLIVLDRWSGVYPDAELINDLANPLEFGLPRYYRCDMGDNGQSVKIHHSRVIRFQGRDLPNWEKQVQMYWGLSEIELVFDELRKRDYTSWNIVSLLTRAQIMTIKEPELASALSGLGMSEKAMQAYLTRMQAISDSMNNQGLLPLGKDGSLENTTYSFSGLPEVYVNFMLDICGACEMSMSKLFGRSATGLGQTGEGENQAYYDTIEQKRNREVRPQLNKLFPVIAMSTWGKVPKDLTFKFAPVRTLSDRDKSDLAKSNSDAVIAAFNAGIIGRKTALMELKQQADVTGIFSNISDDTIAGADDEVDAMGELGGMDPSGAVERTEAKETKPERETAMGKSVKDSALPSRFQTIFAGIPITIEYAKGDRRTITNDDEDVVYDRVMQHDYGFIDDTAGRDGDEIDVILGPNLQSQSVYVVDMQDLGPDIGARQDEDKVMLGFKTEAEAKRAFLSMYPPSFLAGVEAMPLEQFKVGWLGISEALGAAA